MQQYVAEGMDHAAQIKSIAIAEGYLDVSRHEVRQSQAGKRRFEAMNVGLQAHALIGLVLLSLSCASPVVACKMFDFGLKWCFAFHVCIYGSTQPLMLQECSF